MSAEPPLPLTSQQRAFTLAGTLLGLLLAALDQTVVATAGPAIQESLRIEPALYPWITTSYMVASTVLVPIWGKLSDLFGRRAVLVAGIVLFLAGSALCGVSTGTVQLILFRALQGLGSASLFTSAFAVLADLFSPAERGRYTGLFGAVFGLASVVGPLVGGFLTDTWGWHWVFFVNLPVGALALLLIFAKMPRLRPAPRERVAVDFAGAGFLALAVVPLLLALSLGRARGMPGPGYPWGAWPIVTLLLTGVAGVLLFVWRERRAPDPVLDLRLFENRVFAVGNLAAFVLGAGFLAAVVFLPLFMVNVVGVSATHAGLTTVPLTFGIIAGNVTAGQLLSRLGRYKGLMLLSLGVLVAGFCVMGFTLTPESTQGEVTAKMVLLGLGLGPSLPLYTLAVQNAVAPEHAGVATSASTFFRQMGSTLGVALAGTVFATTFAAQLAQGVQAIEAQVPPELRAQLGAVARPGGSEGAVELRFDVARARAQVRERFAALDAQARQAFEGDAAAREALMRDAALPMQVKALLLRQGPGAAAAAHAELEREERALAVSVDALARTFKGAFTEAIERVYRIGILIAVLGLLVTAFLPELPLRRGRRVQAPVAE